MKILVTGKYEPDYNRNYVLLRGLKNQRIELVEYPYLKRDRETKSEISRLVNDCDLVFLPSFTHLDVPFIRKITGKLLVFDPLISRYLSKVFDYKTVWKYSPRAYKNYLKDSKAFRRSDLILADTRSHRDYYIRKFGVDPEKISVVYVGVCTHDFYPGENDNNESGKTVVGFYGSFIPLHGIAKIISAAKILEERQDIEFRLYGDGPGHEKIRELINRLRLKNTFLEGWVDYKSLQKVISRMDICLGIFGDSLKADLVIPNKIFHYSACRKPVITANTTGIKEIFEDGSNIVLINNDANSLANSILKIADNPGFRSEVAGNAFELITRDYNENKIARSFIEAVNRTILSCNSH